MIRVVLRRVLEGGGEAAGKMELIKTSLDDARAYAEAIFKKNKLDLDEEIPNFDANYTYVQNMAGLGKTKRKDMPVIDTEDIKNFQKRLEKGFIDINSPHADDELNLNNNPFPQGLTGAQAKKWLKDGLVKYDGEKNDDKVKVNIKTVRVGDLKPIQKQIYFDKSIGSTAEFGAKGTIDFLTKKTVFVASADLFIIDGHHRWLSGNLIDPNMKIQALVIDLPIDKLLPLSIAYGDSIGNKRNEHHNLTKEILENINEAKTKIN